MGPAWASRCDSRTGRRGRPQPAWPALRLEPGSRANLATQLAVRVAPKVTGPPTDQGPERFLEQRYAASEFLPFGGGHRRCLGAAFAENELRLVLGTLVTEWDLELTSSEPERAVRRNVTMGPERGVPVRFLGARV